MASQLGSGVCWLNGSLEPHFQKVSNPSQHRPRPARRGPHLAGCLVYKTEKHLRAFFRDGKGTKQKELGPTEDLSLRCSAGVGTPFPHQGRITLAVSPSPHDPSASTAPRGENAPATHQALTSRIQAQKP